MREHVGTFGHTWAHGPTWAHLGTRMQKQYRQANPNPKKPLETHMHHLEGISFRRLTNAVSSPGCAHQNIKASGGICGQLNFAFVLHHRGVVLKLVFSCLKQGPLVCVDCKNAHQTNYHKC